MRDQREIGGRPGNGNETPGAEAEIAATGRGINMLGRLARGALVTALLGLICLLGLDLMELISRPEEHEIVHGFSESEELWIHQSKLNYGFAVLSAIAYLMVGIALTLLHGRNEVVTRYRMLYMYIVSALAFMLVQLLLWSWTGFDH